MRPLSIFLLLTAGSSPALTVPTDSYTTAPTTNKDNSTALAAPLSSNSSKLNKRVDEPIFVDPVIDPVIDPDPSTDSDTDDPTDPAIYTDGDVIGFILGRVSGVLLYLKQSRGYLTKRKRKKMKMKFEKCLNNTNHDVLRCNTTFPQFPDLPEPRHLTKKKRKRMKMEFEKCLNNTNYDIHRCNTTFPQLIFLPGPAPLPRHHKLYNKHLPPPFLTTTWGVDAIPTVNLMPSSIPAINVPAGNDLPTITLTMATPLPTFDLVIV